MSNNFLFWQKLLAGMFHPVAESYHPDGGMLRKSNIGLRKAGKTWQSLWVLPVG